MTQLLRKVGSSDSGVEWVSVNIIMLLPKHPRCGFYRPPGHSVCVSCASVLARTGQSSSRRRVRPWPVWGQRRGIAAGEPRGCGRPPWVGSARYVKLLAAKLAQYMRAALRAPRCREPWPGSEPLKTVDAQFSVLRRTCSVSELCIISLHANK